VRLTSEDVGRHRGREELGKGLRLLIQNTDKVLNNLSELSRRAVDPESCFSCSGSVGPMSVAVSLYGPKGPLSSEFSIQ
jgi:hypothetical protein